MVDSLIVSRLIHTFLGDESPLLVQPVAAAQKRARGRPADFVPLFALLHHFVADACTARDSDCYGMLTSTTFLAKALDDDALHPHVLSLFQLVSANNETGGLLCIQVVLSAVDELPLRQSANLLSLLMSFLEYNEDALHRHRVELTIEKMLAAIDSNLAPDSSGHVYQQCEYCAISTHKALRTRSIICPSLSVPSHRSVFRHMCFRCSCLFGLHFETHD